MRDSSKVLFLYDLFILWDIVFVDQCSDQAEWKQFLLKQMQEKVKITSEAYGIGKIVWSLNTIYYQIMLFMILHQPSWDNWVI